MSGPRVPAGVAHTLPDDLRAALVANATALEAWKDITAWPQRVRIRRTQEELEEGERRPCCWSGCDHRERTAS